MSFRVASRGSGRPSSRVEVEGSGGVGSMAMSISGSSSGSEVGGAGLVVGEEVEGGFGVDMMVVGVGTVRVGR